MSHTRSLTERQIEVLRQFGFEAGWLRPMDLGGRDGSNHSGILARLEGRGLVESRQRSGGDGGARRRGSKVYRLTAAGRSELDHELELRRVASGRRQDGEE